MAIGVPKWKQN